MTETRQQVGIVGAGAWGTALAMVAGRAGRSVRLYARDPDAVTVMNRAGENPARLPGAELSPHVRATGDLAEAAACRIVLLAVPAQAVADAAASLAPLLAPGTPVVICAKGIDRASGRRLSQILHETAPQAAVAVLSGPGFAADVARGLPTAVTIAAENAGLALELCHILGGPTFRPYAETDVIGVELGGALKNILAIAAGIVAGRQLGASAQAALIARGFAELRRFADQAGARPETLMGLSGLGDLVLTCSGPQSRNFALGFAIGADAPRPEALAEGVATAAVTRDLARRDAIAMPVTDAVAAVLERALSVEEAVDSLMNRPLRSETD